MTGRENLVGDAFPAGNGGMVIDRHIPVPGIGVMETMSSRQEAPNS
jgi:hypothetical protein